jgi:hypothetical protein
MTVELPDNCLKGIPNQTFIFGRKVNYTLFLPSGDSPSDDGWYESSINWEECICALNELLDRHKENGDIHFKAGVARIPRVEIDGIIKKFGAENDLSYEKKELQDNPYHGNIKFSASLMDDKLKKVTICGALAFAISEIISQNTLTSI